MTSNPSIFEKAIAESHDYDDDIKALALKGEGVKAIYENLSQRDVQSAADEFRPLYDSDGRRRRICQPGGQSPPGARHERNDTGSPPVVGRARPAQCPHQGSGDSRRTARHPATDQRRNQRQRDATLWAASLSASGGSLHCRHRIARWPKGSRSKHVASVASFFVSRIDALVDPLLEKSIAQGGKDVDLAKKAHGQVAIASAKMAYQIYKEMFGSDRFRKLAAQGALVQRLLWASTSTKNPAYSDVKYVEALIGPHTVNTAPMETLDAYRDHGDPKARLEQEVEESRSVLERLPELGISIDDVTRQLEDEGVEKFNEPFDKLMETLAQRSSPHLAKAS